MIKKLVYNHLWKVISTSINTILLKGEVAYLQNVEPIYFYL